MLSVPILTAPGAYCPNFPPLMALMLIFVRVLCRLPLLFKQQRICCHTDRRSPRGSRVHFVEECRRGGVSNFHWHIVDSIPVELSDEPTILMFQYGAYGHWAITNLDDIIDPDDLMIRMPYAHIGPPPPVLTPPSSVGVTE